MQVGSVFVHCTAVPIVGVHLLHHVWTNAGQWVILHHPNTGACHGEPVTVGGVLQGRRSSRYGR